MAKKKVKDPLVCPICGANKFSRLVEDQETFVMTKNGWTLDNESVVNVIEDLTCDQCGTVIDFNESDKQKKIVLEEE